MVMTRPAKTFELLHESHVNNFWWFGRWCFRSNLTVIQFLTVRLGLVCSRNYRFIQKLQIHCATVSSVNNQYSVWAFECHQLGATLFHAGICHMIFVFFSWHLRYTGFGWIWTYQSKTCTGLQSRKLAEVIFTFFHLEARRNCCFELALADQKCRSWKLRGRVAIGPRKQSPHVINLQQFNPSLPSSSNCHCWGAPQLLKL